MTLHFTGWEQGVKEGRSGLPHVSEQGIQWEKITLFALRSRFCLRSSKTVHGLRSCLTSKLHRLLFKSPKALSLCFFTNQISHYISLSLNKLVSVVEKKKRLFPPFSSLTLFLLLPPGRLVDSHDYFIYICTTGSDCLCSNYSEKWEWKGNVGGIIRIEKQRKEMRMSISFLNEAAI